MKSALYRFITIFVIGSATLVGYATLYSSIVDQSNTVVSLQKQIDAKTESLSRTAAARAALSEIADDEAKVQGYFVPETGVVSFIDDLETRGRTLGSTVSVLSVSNAVVNKRPILQFSIMIKGSFDAVMRTIGEVEYAPYDISLSTLSVAQDEKNSWHANLQLIVGSAPIQAATSTQPVPPNNTPVSTS